MTKAVTKTRTQILPLREDNNELKFFSPSDEAKRLMKNFAKTFKSHENPSDKEFIEETDKLLNDYLN